MPYSVKPHTADIRLKLSGKSFAVLLEQSVMGLMKILAGKVSPTKVIRRVEVSATDKTCLLVDFLNEVLALAETNREQYSNVEIIELTDHKTTAKLTGTKVHNFTQDVKAVTYHEAEVIEDDGMWKVNLVLDV